MSKLYRSVKQRRTILLALVMILSTGVGYWNVWVLLPLGLRMILFILACMLLVISGCLDQSRLKLARRKVHLQVQAAHIDRLNKRY